ncbi:hypothetical protein [Maliponia aquimaris]|uniref:hypothetical protein n=1 Tax=Maliponia aquimaris TaxID=1673631 RepID=UPI00114072E7|nr:hypothetical protein [Maliponia aquimaris]
MGDNRDVTTQAEAPGQTMAAEGWRLVRGAGDVGLIGCMARAAVPTARSSTSFRAARRRARS